jgi:hypothetical protein
MERLEEIDMARYVLFLTKKQAQKTLDVLNDSSVTDPDLAVVYEKLKLEQESVNTRDWINKKIEKGRQQNEI